MIVISSVRKFTFSLSSEMSTIYSIFAFNNLRYLFSLLSIDNLTDKMLTSIFDLFFNWFFMLSIFVHLNNTKSIRINTYCLIIIISNMVKIHLSRLIIVNSTRILREDLLVDYQFCKSELNFRVLEV